MYLQLQNLKTFHTVIVIKSIWRIPIGHKILSWLFSHGLYNANQCCTHQKETPKLQKIILSHGCDIWEAVWKSLYAIIEIAITFWWCHRVCIGLISFGIAESCDSLCCGRLQLTNIRSSQCWVLRFCLSVEMFHMILAGLREVDVGRWLRDFALWLYESWLEVNYVFAQRIVFSLDCLEVLLQSVKLPYLLFKLFDIPFLTLSESTLYVT